ncbi:hypothetical protein RvY_07388 [Ramazzottius varieornatus]|uniref:PLD phosphodiesterase domain-containing protein n=1 Tax=Ramazzottius varieornatus TaxID=947166 RepID=A0A1D1VAF6_RAMVA|nr:hypothetical protein RvY_07388 [Ramazzottius varieornatus]
MVNVFILFNRNLSHVANVILAWTSSEFGRTLFLRKICVVRVVPAGITVGRRVLSHGRSWRFPFHLRVVRNGSNDSDSALPKAGVVDEQIRLQREENFKTKRTPISKSVKKTVLSVSAENRADFVALELGLGDSRNMQRLNEAKKKRAIEPWCFPVSIMGILILLIIFLPFISTDKLDQRGRSQPCNDQECRLILSESMPRHLKYPKEAPLFPSTFRTWEDLIHMAQHSIDIASFYWDLHRGEGLVSSHRSPQHQGERIFNLLVNAGLKRKLKVRVAQSAADARFPDNDTSVLQKLGAAEVRSLNFTYLLGSGVLHTKMWTSDNRQFWVGSANMDWRSLTEVKELGLAGINCSCMAQDLAKVFSVYWYLGEEPQKPVPPHWPTAYSTHINRTNPLSLFYNNSKTPSLVYMASSPPPFSANGRNSDIDELLNVVSGAQILTYIAEMDSTPVLQDQHGKSYSRNAFVRSRTP